MDSTNDTEGSEPEAPSPRPLCGPTFSSDYIPLRNPNNSGGGCGSSAGGRYGGAGGGASSSGGGGSGGSAGLGIGGAGNRPSGFSNIVIGSSISPHINNIRRGWSSEIPGRPRRDGRGGQAALLREALGSGGGGVGGGSGSGGGGAGPSAGLQKRLHELMSAVARVGGSGRMPGGGVGEGLYASDGGLGGGFAAAAAGASGGGGRSQQAAWLDHVTRSFALLSPDFCRVSPEDKAAAVAEWKERLLEKRRATESSGGGAARGGGSGGEEVGGEEPSLRRSPSLNDVGLHHLELQGLIMQDQEGGDSRGKLGSGGGSDGESSFSFAHVLGSGRHSISTGCLELGRGSAGSRVAVAAAAAAAAAAASGGGAARSGRYGGEGDGERLLREVIVEVDGDGGNGRRGLDAGVDEEMGLGVSDRSGVGAGASGRRKHRVYEVTCLCFHVTLPIKRWQQLLLVSVLLIIIGAAIAFLVLFT
eukprot:TRINITY_DN5802_c0_g2_i2.p1 TRINITY_DN5802_c0_g2~~TRINITY_DN5802_c0_g2_i2.p1  ORF type:complete len:509 (-),score=-1.90 TRINITY_DN5802_c0_g2_i2:733-2154(-)